MRSPITDIRARRSMLRSAGAAIAVFAAGSRSAAAQTSATFVPARHPQDEWFSRLPGRHRTIIDCASPHAAGEGLLFANNIYVANKTGYQLDDHDIAIVVCLRHDAVVFAYNDAIWAKYAKALSDAARFTDPKTTSAPTMNLLDASGYDAVMPNMGVTLSELGRRGVQFAVCDMATHGISEIVAKAIKAQPDAIYRELVANLIPNSHLVAAGVVAINRAQEYGYTLLTAS